MTPTKKAFIELHIAVFLFGFTAILGEVIDLHPLVLTWWRVVLASVFFLFFPRIFRRIATIPKRLFLTYFIIGGIVALHWLTFYAAIKASNASITLICLATATFFTALFEPLIMKKRISTIELGVGLAILPGMVLIVNSTAGQYSWGIILGLSSAILAALFGALNKRYLGDQDPISVTLIEMVAATALLSLCLPFIISSTSDVSIWPSNLDWFYLIVLALICTNVAYLLALRALRHLTAYTSALTINLEPLYGIILAAILLGQHHDLNIRFYIGALVILLAVIGFPLLSKRQVRKERQRTEDRSEK